MKYTNDFDILHRSKDRIQRLGEVFTPKIFVEQMIDLISQDDISDENVIFFEPTCGHGNIVESLLLRRMKSLYEKSKKNKQIRPGCYAVANAINTLWAIDIDLKNVQQCRIRVLKAAINFLKQVEEQSIEQVISENLDFISHIFCSIIWQIHQNEMFSALSDKCDKNFRTKAEKSWLRTHQHHPINFSCTWVHHWNECIKNKEPDTLHQWVVSCLRQLITHREFKDRELEKIVIFVKCDMQKSTGLLKTRYHYVGDF